MTEVVEADPLDLSLPCGAFEPAVSDIAVQEPAREVRTESSSCEYLLVVVMRILARETEVDQIAAEVIRDWDAADAGDGRGRPCSPRLSHWPRT